MSAIIYEDETMIRPIEESIMKQVSRRRDTPITRKRYSYVKRRNNKTNRRNSKKTFVKTRKPTSK